MSIATIDRAGVRVTSRRVEGAAEQIRLRFLQDAFTEARAAQWRRRAEAFEWCRPRPGDFNGRATADELAARDARLARLARLCRFHARLIETSNGTEMAAELAEMLAAEGVA